MTHWIYLVISRSYYFNPELVSMSTALAIYVIIMPTLFLEFVLLIWIIRPFNPRGEGFGFVEWPNRARTFFRKRPQPRPSKAFAFLQNWLSDPVHIKMIAYMSSGTRPPSHVYNLAEEAVLWQLSSDAWEHEKNCLSTESERLERQAIEKPNLNTLKQLVQCRRTTRKLQDSIKILHRQMPPLTLDWECAMKSWTKDGMNRPNGDRTGHFARTFLPLYHTSRRIRSSHTGKSEVIKHQALNKPWNSHWKISKNP